LKAAKKQYTLSTILSSNQPKPTGAGLSSGSFLKTLVTPFVYILQASENWSGRINHDPQHRIQKQIMTKYDRKQTFGQEE